MSLMPKTLSPTRMGKFKNCPMSWAYERLNLPSVNVDSSRNLYGKSIHSIIVLYYTTIPNNPTEEEIEKVASHVFEVGKTPVMSRFGQRNKQVLKHFISFEKTRLETWKQYKPTFTERMLDGKLFQDTPPFRCITDAYWEKDGVIVDWKTGKTEITEGFMIQGKVNELLAEFNNLSVKKVLFFGLWTGQSIQIPRVTEGWIHEIAREMVDMIEKQHFPKKRSGLCRYCPYQIRCMLEGKKELWCEEIWKIPLA